MEEQIRNNGDIIKLYNKMQNSIIKYTELKVEYPINAFEIFQIHKEGTLFDHENDLVWKLSLAVFKELFEGKDNFNKIDDEKAEYINILIDLNQPKENESSKTKMKNTIINILLTKNNLSLGNLGKCLFDLGIDEKLIYLFFLLINYRDENADDLIEYLSLILKTKFPSCDFLFDNAFGENFFLFSKIIVKFFDKSNLDNYSIIKYDKTKQEIIVTKKPNKVIEDFICDSSFEKTYEDNKKEKIKKSKKKKNKNKNKNYTKDNLKNDVNNSKIEKKIENTNNNVKNEIKNSKKEDKTEKAINNEEEETKINSENLSDKINPTEVSDGMESNKKIEYFQRLYEQIMKENKMINEKYNEMNEKYKELKKNNDELKKNNDEIKKNFDEMKSEKKEMEQKFNIILKENKELKKNDSDLSKKYKKIDIQYKILLNDFKLTREKCERLNYKYVELKKETSELKFILKIIGLRAAYRSLIDLFVIILGLDCKGNLVDKINQINKKISVNSINQNIFPAFFNDIKALLDIVNKKAHDINEKENIYKNLIINLGKYNHTNNYEKLNVLLEKIKVEDEFNKLVILKNEKFKTTRASYIIEEKKIIQMISDKIKSDDFLKILGSNQ